MHSIIVHPAASLQGTLVLPGDKSISHRAVIFSSLAEGTTRLRNLLEGDDVLCTIDCFRAMGVPIEKEGEEWVVKGVGLKGLRAPQKVLYCGNSGTTLRLLLGVLAAQPFEARLTGDASLNKRPVKRVTDPLSQMGAQFSVEGEGSDKRIVCVKGGALRGIDYRSPVASAQVKSAILLAGLWAQGGTSVTEPLVSRDHTERILEAAGVSIQRSGTKVSLRPPPQLKIPSTWTVPGDFSSAAFFLVGGCLVPASEIYLEKVGLNPTRTGALDILKAMGAKISIEENERMGGEEIGTLKIQFSSLTGTNIEGALIPRLIDEIPILAVAAAKAKGRTEIRDAAELKVKESDRIRILGELLRQIGVSAQERPDGLLIEGPKAFRSAEVQSFGDHRMAMAMAIAALVAEGPITIHDIDCVKTSFPSFWECLRKLGASVTFL